MEHLAVYLIEYASVPVIVSAIFAAYFYSGLGAELRIICHFIFLSVAVELSSKILWLNSENNLPLLHLYVLLGFYILSRFYKRLLDEFIPNKLIDIVTIFFSVYTIVNSLFIEPLTSFNSSALTIQAILMIILCVFTFLVLMNDIVREKRSDLLSSFNWINSGLFLYYLSSLMVFYFGKLFIQYYSHLTNQYLWSLHSMFVLIMNVCLIIGLWRSHRKLA